MRISPYAEDNGTHSTAAEPSSGLNSAHSSTDLAVAELVRRAERDIARGRLGRAARHYFDALRLQPNNVQALLGLSKLRARQGDAKEAERLLSKAVRQRNAAEAHEALAELLATQGHAARALAHLQIAATEEPTRERLANLGQEYVKRRAYPAALQAWRSILSLNPEDPDAALQVFALQLLSGSLDPVLAGAETHNWIRRSLARIAERGPRALTP